MCEHGSGEGKRRCEETSWEDVQVIRLSLGKTGRSTDCGKKQGIEDGLEATHSEGYPSASRLRNRSLSQTSDLQGEASLYSNDSQPYAGTHCKASLQASPTLCERTSEVPGLWRKA